MLKRIRWYLWVLAGIFLAYLVVSIYFMEHFFPGTTVNGEGADLLTVREANSLILAQAEGYELKLLERGGSEEILTAEQLGMSFSETDSVRKYKRIQNGFLWPRMFWQQDAYQIAPDITFDDDTWKDTLAALSCVREGESPKDAWVEFEAVKRGCEEGGYPLYVTEDANHSLETGNVAKDLENLQEIMRVTEEYIGS